MDKTKTPEEIASESIRQTLDYIDTVAMPKNYPDKVDMQVRMLASSFAKAISAERNANAEKIKESDKCIDDLRFELGKQASWCIKLRNTMRETEKLFADELKSLESKLAEAEKEIKALKYENERFNKDKGVSGVSFEKYSRLEAEAKALKEYNLLIQINSLDLEEIEKAIAGDFEYSNEYENLTSFFREVFDKKKSAIRALNSGKD